MVKGLFLLACMHVNVLTGSWCFVLSSVESMTTKLQCFVTQELSNFQDFWGQSGKHQGQSSLWSSQSVYGFAFAFIVHIDWSFLSVYHCVCSIKWLVQDPMVKAPTLRTSQTQCRTTLHSESPPSWLNIHLIHSWILTPHTLWFSQTSPFLSELCYPPLSDVFDIPPSTASMCLNHLAINRADSVTWNHHRLYKKKSFCIRNYFTLLCIMFLHNFYLYMNIKVYK